MKKRNIFLRAYDVIILDGFAVLLRQILLRLRLEFLLLPFVLIAIPGKKFGNLDDLIDYGFKVGGGLIRPLQIRSEIKRLLEIVVERNPEVILEIGTYNGGTLFLFSHVIPWRATIISIDFPDVRFGGGYDWWKTPLFNAFKLRGQTLTLIRADSHKVETLNEVKKVIKERKVDFIFIDGDHSYEGVRQDFEMYNPFLATNGFMAFHDIVSHVKESGCEVNKYWEELKNSRKYDCYEIIENKAQSMGGIGIVYKSAY